jgi:hypothetical protein
VPTRARNGLDAGWDWDIEWRRGFLRESEATVMRFARWVFWLSGISGILLTVPPYFMEAQTGQNYPPPVTHPEYYYGFFGVTVAWQVLFLVIGSDPVRYRLAMLPAMLEKASFVAAMLVLYFQERLPALWLAFVATDGIWLVLFLIAYLRTPTAASVRGGSAHDAELSRPRPVL